MTNSAAADGFSERLSASIGGATAGITTNNGGFALLGAGATDNTSLAVGIDISTAGAKSGTATIALASDGADTSGFGALGLDTQTVNLSGSVYRLADAGPIAAISFSNAHVGDLVSQALTVTNTAIADGFSEALNASFSGVSDARIQTAGSVNLLGAGASDSASLVITLDTSTAGSVNGFANLALVSDGTGTSDLGLTELGTRNVDVITNIAVYRFADGAVENAPPTDLGAYRVGNQSSSVGLAIRNTAADDRFSESLNAGVGSITTGFTVNGAVSLLAAQSVDSNGIQVGVDTTLAGTLIGSVTVDFESDGAGTSELGQNARGNQQLALTARVYAVADLQTCRRADVQTSNIDFGTVHVGDVVGARNVIMRNAASGDLTDTLLGSIATAATGFTVSGTLGTAGLAAGATDNTNLRVALDTSSAGVFSGSALASFATHNSELADGALDGHGILLAVQVNSFANPVLADGGGAGTFGGMGGSFTYDFGGLAAGDSRALAVLFDPLALGSFNQVISIALFGTNASGFEGFIGNFDITVIASVNAVPLPGGVWMLGSALAGLIAVRRRRMV